MGRVDLTIHRCSRCDALADRLAEAEERIRDLREALGGPDNWVAPFGLTRMQARFLRALVFAPGGVCSLTDMMTALYSDSPDEYPSSYMVKVLTYHVRRRTPVRINTIRGRGLELHHEDRARLRRWHPGIPDALLAFARFFSSRSFPA